MTQPFRSSAALAPFLILLAVASVPACGRADTRPQETTLETETDAAGVAAAIGRGDSWKTDFSRISVPPGEIVSGGPPKDGIPAIDSPKFESAAEANRYLDEADPVIVVELNGEAKAYPLNILIWHEIVNDEVGGQPVTVTFCPLCNTALVFDRQVNGQVLDFGTTGRLRHSDLIMYDRQTETWWQQAVGEAIVGEMLGTVLDFVSANTLGWGMARSLHPDIQVLSRDTGHRRDYGRNPYVGYDDPGNQPIARFFGAKLDPKLRAMERVVAVDVGDGWAVSHSELADVRVVNEEVDGTPIVVVWVEGAASALDDSQIRRGRDVGQTSVFDRRLGNQVLTFEWMDGEIRDRETGSTWDLAGRGQSGPLAGERLTPVPHGNHFWFAWVTFRPDTALWSS